MPDEASYNTPPPLALVRDLDKLASTEFDLVVVGGGIYGVWATLDAARRGLKVALIEQNDFGSGASANSQRVVHGGLRYLQHADFKRMRESIRERSTLLDRAGNLVEPMPFLVPTYGLGMRGKPVMLAAMKINDLFNAIFSSYPLPHGRLICKDACLKLAPGIDERGLTGGAIFYDAQVNNSERLALAVLNTAVANTDVQLANHVRATGLQREDSRVTGITCEDQLTGHAFTVNAKVTLGCAGPWTGHVGADLLPEEHRKQHDYPMIRAVALVTRELFDGMGIALPSPKAHSDQNETLGKGFRNLFVTSWNGLSLVGTFYDDFTGDPGELSVGEDEVCGFVDEFNQTYPAAGLTYDDVKFTFMGLQPKAPKHGGSEPIASKQYKLINHQQAEGIQGLITVLGVKWTTARDVAEKAVDQVLKQLGTSGSPQRTHDTILEGASNCNLADHMYFITEGAPAWVDDGLVRDLMKLYGNCNISQILKLAHDDPGLRDRVCEQSRTIAAQIVFAARYEMALTLIDVLLHRTDVLVHGYPGRACLERCADLMAGVLKWEDPEKRAQIQQVETLFRSRGLKAGDEPAGPAS